MADLIVMTNQLGDFATNCYIVGNTKTREAIVIDPADEADYIYKCMTDGNFKCTGIFLTHGHYDHIGALEDLKRITNVKTYASEDEKQILESRKGNLSAMFGHPVEVSADVYLKDGQEISILGNTMKCISVPGHTIGGMCYYFADDGILFSGDTLFASSVGRSDFPTGNAHDLIEAIQKKLLVLPDETIVYPGHNSYTRIGKEKKFNPFLS